jgi:glycine hydroxymethyltransferase
VNKNAIPFDKHPPNTASGIRLGTPATTSRGFGEPEMVELSELIVGAIAAREDDAEQTRIAGRVRAMSSRFPVPGLPEP